MSNLIREFCDLINQNEESGDVIEFGTGGGTSTNSIASDISKERKIFTFDGFQGLPETKKGYPINTGWAKGVYCYDENVVKEFLKQHSNVIVEKTMTWNLKNPSEYGIQKIIAANMDLDLYEGTIDGLRFIDKCDWNTLLLRFDDWGAYFNMIKSEVDAHEKAAFFDWIAETNYQHEIDINLLNRSGNRQSIIFIKR